MLYYSRSNFCVTILLSFALSSPLLSQNTLNPSIVWEIKDSLTIDIQSTKTIDNKGNTLIIGYNKDNDLVTYQVNNKGELSKIQSSALHTDLTITAIELISKDTAIFAGLNKDNRIIIGQIDLKTGELSKKKFLHKKRKGLINGLIPMDEGTLLVGREGQVAKDTFDVILVSVNSKGKELWYNSFGSDIGSEEIMKGYIDKNQELILAAYSDDFNAKKHYAWILSINSDGKNLWERKYGSPLHSTKAMDVCQGLDNQPLYVANFDHRIRVSQMNKIHDTYWTIYLGDDDFIYKAKGIAYDKDDFIYVFGNIYTKSGQLKGMYRTKLQYINNKE